MNSHERNTPMDDTQSMTAAEIAREQLEETRRLRIATEKMNKRQGFSIVRVFGMLILLGFLALMVAGWLGGRQ